VARALIAVTAYREPAVWGVWSEPADLLPASYAQSVENAGAVPIILPSPRGGYGEAAARVLDAVDGVLVAGGADVDPGRYGAVRIASTGGARPERDAWELCLIRTAVARGTPLLGVCRGMQVMNVALGGSLIQHLPDVVGHDGHCPVVGEHGRHRVRTEPGSRLETIMGVIADVATYHHQAVDRVAPALRATAWADDGIVEGVEAIDGSWTVGVQWHPEVHAGDELFTRFVRECEI